MAIEFCAWNTPNGRKISVALEEMGLPYTVHAGQHLEERAVRAGLPEDQPEQQDPGDHRSRRAGRPPISVFEFGRDPDLSREKTGEFYPADLRGQVPVLEWLMWQMGGFGPMPGQVHHFLQVENPQDQRYGLERYSKENRATYGVLDNRLAGREYRGGRAFDRRFRDCRLGLAARAPQDDWLTFPT